MSIFKETKHAWTWQEFTTDNCEICNKRKAQDKIGMTDICPLCKKEIGDDGYYSIDHKPCHVSCVYTKEYLEWDEHD